MTTDPTVFKDTEHASIDITEPELLGTHTYENVLYTGADDAEVVDIVTGETPSSLDRPVDDAVAFAEKTSDQEGAPRVAKAVRGQRAIESRSPYVASAFFHMDITGGLAWHTVFRKAYDSDAYVVEHDANYTTGTLTITVERADA
jgi:hypothetical protein